MKIPIAASDEALFAAYLDENLAEGHLQASGAENSSVIVAYVAEHGTVGMMRLLQDRGFPVASLPCRGYGDFQEGYPHDDATPLFFAAYYGRTDMVRFLLDAGADVNARDSVQATPLMSAAFALNSRYERRFASCWSATPM